MLSLVVLFIVFLGLVGVLALFSEWEKKRSPPLLAGLAEVVGWIEVEGCRPPSTEELVAVFNRVAHKKRIQPDDGVSLGGMVGGRGHGWSVGLGQRRQPVC